MSYLRNDRDLHDEICNKLKPVDDVKLDSAIQRTCRNIIETAFQDLRFAYYDDDFNESVFESFGEYVFMAVYQQPIAIEGIQQLGFPKDICNIIHKMSDKTYYLFFESDYDNKVNHIEYAQPYDDRYTNNQEFIKLSNKLYLLKLMHQIECYDSISDVIERYNSILSEKAAHDVRFIETCNRKIAELLDLPDNTDLLYKFKNDYK